MSVICNGLMDNELSYVSRLSEMAGRLFRKLKIRCLSDKDVYASVQGLGAR